MDFLSPVGQLISFFWDPVSQQINYLRKLDGNVATLVTERDKLISERDEIQVEVEHAITLGKTRVVKVEKWLVDVSKMVAEVDSIKLEVDQRSTCCNGYCCTDPYARYKLGKRVVCKIKDVEKLKREGVFAKVDESPRRGPVQEMQFPQQLLQQITSLQTLEEIWQSLHDDKISIICVYGMGGIGKTTLMQAINDKFIGTNDFDVVIWVTVSMDLNLGVIQEKIGDQLKVEFGRDESFESRRGRLLRRLKNVRYVLILDDLWEAFSLDRVGIPKPDEQNRCKIAITTRSITVSNAMEANKSIRVHTLSEDEAWNLFHEKSGEVILLAKIRPLAKRVVRECAGLPLAVKTVGCAMRHKDKEFLWDDALRALKGSAPEVSGMEREVFLPLKHSYDCLGDPKIQSCFLYCSLYPEDDDIPVIKLVRNWSMEEGLIDNVNSLEEALNKGRTILERLKDACLLEQGRKDDDSVRMHDLLRDLAIWITSPSSPSSSSSPMKASKFLVKVGKGLLEPPEEHDWEGMRRISLMNNKIRELQIMPNCFNLVSLFLSGNRKLRTLHPAFFEHMTKLQILDLSYTHIKLLPDSLSRLLNLRALILRHCVDLVEMPPLGQLEKLQLLDLSSTGIQNLPEGFPNLFKLKWLDLSDTVALATIPSNMISSLTNLEVLSLRGTEYFVSSALLREVGTLTRLTSLAIDIFQFDGFITHDMDYGLWSNFRSFDVRVGDNDWDDWQVGDKAVRIHGCNNFPNGIEGLIRHADYIFFEECQGIGITHFSQFVSNSQSLRHIEVYEFGGLKCFIDWREMGYYDALEHLEGFRLHYLPNLEQVFDGGEPLSRASLQRLKTIDVTGCHKLRFLFSSNMVNLLHQLEELSVTVCDEMEEIVQGEMLSDIALPRLCSLDLVFLPKLSNICRNRHIFRSLRKIDVHFCSGLKKLPLLCSSIHDIKGGIVGDRDWWEGLEWEDDHSKSLYSSLYWGRLGRRQ